MGRGRAKAKQTKVARDLKYRTHETDFGALARELHGDDHAPPGSEVDIDTDEVDEDPYAEADDDSDESDDWADYSRS